MTNHNSPLSLFFSKIKNNNITLEYCNTLDDIFEDLKQPKISKYIFNSNSSNNTKRNVNFAFHPPRIIRKLLEFKLGEYSENALECLNLGIESALEIYQNPKNTSNIITELDLTFKETLSTFEYAKLMYTFVNQESDRISLSASNPKLSYQNSQTLFNVAKQSDILFIALGYGGIMPGLDVFSHYVKTQKKQNPQLDSNSVFYPVRFSRFKLEEKEPNLSLQEILNLESIVDNKQIVIFDEETGTGLTMDLAKSYFETVFGRKDLICFANDSSVDEYNLNKKYAVEKDISFRLPLKKLIKSKLFF
ncbi:MAG: hypothetical protein HRU03_04705 [Nanoarchaeales archaeon]|nr:hypothetical protein [Nanoarchaeales archaeon]